MSRLQNNDRIVIVGGGVIGLSTAYNLAKRSLESSPRIKIQVIEASDACFAASSSNCTGCFHYAFTDPALQPLLPLGEYSFNLWEAESVDPDFKAATGYRAQSSFGISTGTGKGLEGLPDWVTKDPTWDVDTSILGARTATVNPAGVGKWLKRQCLNMGVDVQTSLIPVAVSLSAEKEVQAVACWRNDDLSTIHIDCKQLLLACGPWTPSIYETLFPTSRLRLQWTTDAGDWILCKNPCPSTQNTTAFVSFANLVGEKLEFAARNDGTIWGCGRRNHNAPLPFPCHTEEPDEALIAELSAHARRWLDWSCRCREEHAGLVHVVKKGRAFRPATKSALPLMTEVESLRLTSNSKTVSDTETCSSDLFVCWGHGSYGLTLGMGSGRLMSQLMSGEEPDIDLSPFSLDEDCSRDD